MDYLSAFSTVYGLDWDVELIYGKVSLEVVKTGVMVPVGIFHVEK